MKTKIAVILFLTLFSTSLLAELIQSTTGVQTTFRKCVAGATACDSIGRTMSNGYGGLPGNSESQTSLVSFEYGSASGTAKLLDQPGAADLTAEMKSLAGTRNGGNSFFLQRYTNTSVSPESFTLKGDLKFNLTVPLENADFPVKGGTHSSASAEMELLTLNIDSIEAGSTSMDNNNILNGAEDPGIVYVSLDSAKINGSDNVTGSGSNSGSATAVIAPGDSVWIFAILQSLGANGAEVNARFEARAIIEAVAE